MNYGNKKLTPAQCKHLTELIELKQKTVAECDSQINNFIVYLRNAHDAPVGQWDMKTVSDGFVRKQEGKTGKS